MAGSSGIAAVVSAIAGKFDPNKHKRGAGGKFAFQGGAKAKPTAGKGSGSVAAAHALFDKMKGKPKADILAAAQAIGINPNTAKTQLYHWQKKQATDALAGIKNPTKEQQKQAVAAAIGVKGVEPPKPVDKNADLSPGFHTGKDDKLYFKSKHTGKTFEVGPDGMTKGVNVIDKVHSVKEHGYDVSGKQAAAAHKEHLDKMKEPKAAPKPAPTPKPAPKAEPTPVTATPKEAPSLEKLGPTKYVHALADHMQGSTAKDVKAAAIKAGVNPSTASVQYSKWKAKQNGQAPQLEKSPEPKPLQAKQPADMSDKELDKAIDSYQGKLNVVPESESFAAKPYKHSDDYHDHQGGKALTSKLKPGDVYTNQAQGKTFYKSQSGRIYEHTGGMGQMKLVAGEPSAGEFHYDPATKIVYAKADGVLKPLQSTTPVFKNNQPYDAGDHVFKDHSWANVSGVQDPSMKFESSGPKWEAVKAVHQKAGTKYAVNEATSHYTGSGYSDMNAGLRGEQKLSAYDKKQADVIDAEIAKSSFQEETIMWRGVGSGGTVWNGAPPPAAVSDDAFTSVSFRPDVGKRFSDNKTLFRVKVPKGFPGLNVSIGSPSSGVKGLEYEAEVLLPRGTTYKVVARHAKAGGPDKYGTANSKMDVVDLEPVLPQWYIAKYGQPKLG